MQRRDATPPDWALERFRLGIASPSRHAEVEAALSASPLTRARLRALEAHDAAFFIDHPPAQTLDQIRRRAGLRRQRRRAGYVAWWATPALTTTAAWLLLLARPITLEPFDLLEPSGSIEIPDVSLLPRPPRPTGLEAPQGSGIRLKGAPMLHIDRQRLGEESERLERGASAHEGDVLQISYTAPRGLHGVIFSIDGGAQVTLHAPSVEGDSTALRPSTRLDYAYELDDAPAFERFFMITCPAPMNTHQILEAAEALARSAEAREGALDLPTQAPLCRVADFTILKAERAL